MSKPEKPELPDWYDPKVHGVATGGIVETATGVLLDTDGQPQSGAVRAERAEQAERLRRAPVAAATEPKE